MGNTRWDEDLLADLWTKPPALHLKLYRPLHHDKKLIAVMHVVFPHLPRRIRLHPETETPFLPLCLDLSSLNFFHKLLSNPSAPDLDR